MAHEPAESSEWVCSLCARPKHERYILEKNESFEISISDPESHTTIMTWALKELEAKAARAAAAEAERDALREALNKIAAADGILKGGEPYLTKYQMIDLACIALGIQSVNQQYASKPIKCNETKQTGGQSND